MEHCMDKEACFLLRFVRFLLLLIADFREIY